MGEKSNNKSGLTLTEVIFSLVLLVVIWLTTVSVVHISKASGSRAKHKAQAILVMQRAIEDLRKKPFASITGSTSTVSIDTKGTPDNYSDDLVGTQAITVTSPSSYYKKVVVTLAWNELLLGKNKTVEEYLGTYIANDPQAN
jgi:Tfp pilus assembly protein PilV